ncbi:MAG: hypothetical protein M3125_01720 [Gemmatimonadota bacterium]|nr:hypothetical protein [Gemmatimonadota bacterium]
MAESRSERGRIGQQSGSKRPAPTTGAATMAPKKGTLEPKGTRRPGVARKMRPGKTGGGRPVRARKG